MRSSYAEGFDHGASGQPPIAPPCRTMKETWFGFGPMKETPESIRATDAWRAWSKGWRDGIKANQAHKGIS